MLDFTENHNGEEIQSQDKNYLISIVNSESFPEEIP